MSKIQRRSDVVTIYQGDYLSRIRHIENKYKAAAEAEKNAPLLLGEVAESQALFDEHKALVEEAETTALHIDVFALGRRQYRKLVKEHKPRKDNDNDEALGVNEETFKEVLIPLSIVYPLDHEKAGQVQLDADDLDDLSDIDADRIYLTAFALNRMPSSDPKAISRVSQESTKSDAN